VTDELDIRLSLLMLSCITRQLSAVSGTATGCTTAALRAAPAGVAERTMDEAAAKTT